MASRLVRHWAVRYAPALAITMRPHHWSKNLLVFVPVLAGHRFSVEVIRAAALAFVCFCAAASSGYLINDVLDRHADRAHARKRHRPVAAGSLPINQAIVASVGLALIGFAGAWLLPNPFAAIVASYVLVSVAYSAALKRQPVADLVVLAALFTLRVVGGGEATGVVISKWLLMFSLFLFLALAIIKRCSEIAEAQQSGTLALPGRAYLALDLSVLSALAAAAGFSAVLVLALYLASPEVELLYTQVARLWIVIPFLIYWIGRVLLLSVRGEIHDDPIVFAMTDRITWLVFACIGLIVIAAF